MPDAGRFHATDAVIDCTGTFGDPVPAGLGGLPAPGEREAAAAGRVVYGPVRADPGERAVVVGAGASGCTVVTDLLAERPGLSITWVTFGEVPGFSSPPDDALPARAALYAASAAAAARVERVEDDIVGFSTGAGAIEVRFTSARPVVADRVWVCAGFRPDHRISRELQVHVCWGSEGPMKLAAALLAQQGGGGDCLAVEDPGPQTLRSPEPGFFVLGSKSYGRRSDFLLRTGHQQVRDVIEHLLPG